MCDTFNLFEAQKSKAKLRLSIDGPSGSGKTYSSLLLAYGLCGDWGKIALIDTERGSGNVYSGLCGGGKRYLVGQIDAPFTPKKYLQAIRICETSGAEVIIIDSLTHAWVAEGGFLDMHHAAIKKQKTANGYTAWLDVTPEHRRLIDAILTCPLHVIATVRSETEYAQKKDERGKTVVEKVGMKPQFRKGLDYEMTIAFSMDVSNTATVTKTRIDRFPMGYTFVPTVESGQELLEWLNSGVDVPVCVDCGREIMSYGNMRAEQVAYYTERKYGLKVCVDCGAKRKALQYDDKSSNTFDAFAN